MNDAVITFIYVDDLARSDAFYRQTLGLPLVTEQPVCRIYKVATSGYLGVCVQDRPPTPEGLIITLVRDDVESFCSELAASGVEFERLPSHSDRFGITQAFLRDPDGYLIEIQRFDDPNWSEPIAP